MDAAAGTMDKRGNMADDTLVLELGCDYCHSLCKCLASFPPGLLSHILQSDRENRTRWNCRRRGGDGRHELPGQAKTADSPSGVARAGQKG
jgi:hypothetical protein